MNKILYFDMDGVLVEKGNLDFQKHKYEKGFFLNQKPVEGAVEAFLALSGQYDCYIASTPVWKNQYCWSEKRIWVEKHLGEQAEKRLILLHHKNLLKGDYLIDDSRDHGVEGFEGEHIYFGTDLFPNWPSVVKYLLLIQA